MTDAKKLTSRFGFDTLSSNWRLCALGIDWDGEPLLLFETGRPAFPKPPDINDTSYNDAFLKWINTPPSAHLLVYWKDRAFQTLQLENPEKISPAFVQPFGQGWLFAEARGGYAQITDKVGKFLHAIDVGDAVEQLQTTPDGHIWVGYFDEGVFGNGIGQEGIVCFDSSGEPIFKYAEFAKQHKLPFVDDCYTLNVAGDDVWACYYSDFPLVLLKSFRVERVWMDFGATSAVAIRKDHFIKFPAYRKPYLVSRTFNDPHESIWEIQTPEGQTLSKLEGNKTDLADGYGTVPFSVAARGSRIYFYDEKALYEL